MLYREAQSADIAAMAEIRAADWGAQEYWETRISQYLNYQLHPGEALEPRVAFICQEHESVVGLIAGHLTRRFGCDGELEWISVRLEYRGRGIAAELFQLLAQWFIQHNALRICVDVEPANQVARRFYARHGAQEFKPHWMIWSDLRLAVGRGTAS
jgi:GNAT superfamily N-acetyltransferase